jgi:hypothetical protein
MVISFTSCGTSNKAKSTKTNDVKTVNTAEGKNEEDDILSIVDDKIKSINDRKIDKYLSFYVSDTDTYNAEKLDKTNYFKQYQVKCTVENKTIVNMTKNTAQIQYVVKTTKVKGPGFLDSKALIVDYMKKITNGWKIDSENVLITEYNEPAYGVIYKNIKALNEKDITAYMNTIDKTDIDTYNSYRDQQLDNFDKYDLKYNLESADITSRSDNDTQVSFSETILKKDNSDFNNNRSYGIMHLKKSANSWKVTKIEIKKTEKLN